MLDSSSHVDVLTQLFRLADLQVVEVVDAPPEEWAASFSVRPMYPAIQVTSRGPDAEVTWSFDSPADHPFFHNLPAEAVIPLNPRITSLFTMLAEERDAEEHGGPLVTQSLGAALLVSLLRALTEEDPYYRTPLRNPAVYRAIQLMHGEPGRPWTVNELAAESGTSRSAFYRSFTDTVGVPPATYLAQWRVLLAQERLRLGQTSIDALAYELGYGSAAAFSRAFKRHAGLSPRKWLARAGGPRRPQR